MMAGNDIVVVDLADLIRSNELLNRVKDRLHRIR